MEDTKKIVTYDYQVSLRLAYTTRKTEESEQNFDDCVREICKKELRYMIEEALKYSEKNKYPKLSIRLGGAIVYYKRDQSTFILKDLNKDGLTFGPEKEVTFDELVTRLVQELTVTPDGQKKLPIDIEYRRIVAIGRKNGEVTVRTWYPLEENELLSDYNPDQHAKETAALSDFALPLLAITDTELFFGGESTNLSDEISIVSPSNIAEGLTSYKPTNSHLSSESPLPLPDQTLISSGQTSDLPPSPDQIKKKEEEEEIVTPPLKEEEVTPRKPLPVLPFFAAGAVSALPAILGKCDVPILAADIAGSALNLGALLTVVFEAAVLILFVAMAAQILSQRNNQNSVKPSPAAVPQKLVVGGG